MYTLFKFYLFYLFYFFILLTICTGCGLSTSIKDHDDDDDDDDIKRDVIDYLIRKIFSNSLKYYNACMTLLSNKN